MDGETIAAVAFMIFALAFFSLGMDRLSRNSERDKNRDLLEKLMLHLHGIPQPKPPKAHKSRKIPPAS